MHRISASSAKRERSRLKYIYYPAVWDLMKYTFVSAFMRNSDCVLDVGCSDGYGSSILLETCCKNVIAGDISHNAVDYAKQHYGSEGLTFLCLDATKLPFPDNSFDAVVALEIIEHLPKIEQKRLLSECVRVLKDGSSIICSTPNKETYSTISIGGRLILNPSHVRELSISECHSLLSEHCVDIRFYGQWFMNSGEVIGHRVFLSACLAVEKLAACFKKDIRIGSFIYRIIISIIIPRDRFKFLPLSEDCAKRPLDVIAVGRVVK